jgi:hypothetical protein
VRYATCASRSSVAAPATPPETAVSSPRAPRAPFARAFSSPSPVVVVVVSFAPARVALA